MNNNQGSPALEQQAQQFPFGSEERDWSGHRGYGSDARSTDQRDASNLCSRKFIGSPPAQPGAQSFIFLRHRRMQSAAKLAPKQTVQGLLEALEDMTEKQAACFPNNGTVLLNDKTVGALRQYLHSAVEEDAEHG